PTAPARCSCTCSSTAPDRRSPPLQARDLPTDVDLSSPPWYGGEDGRRPRMKVRFWGVRGSYPVPGPDTNRYGGNTSCVAVRAGDDGPFIIIDAGTGIRKLGKEMMQTEFGAGTGQAHLLVSHTHWDHIQGLPFFA